MDLVKGSITDIDISTSVFIIIKGFKGVGHFRVNGYSDFNQYYLCGKSSEPADGSYQG